VLVRASPLNGNNKKILVLVTTIWGLFIVGKILNVEEFVYTCTDPFSLLTWT
jgi:hypothetical protein